MTRNRLKLALVSAILTSSLAGCLPTVVQTEHDYVLIRTEGQSLILVEDDDPLYQSYSAQVLSEPYPYLLLMLYEHATAALIATNARTPLTQTIANRPIIVVDSAATGVLHDVEVSFEGRGIPIELALGLGNQGVIDLPHATRSLPRVVALLLLELMGLRPPADTGLPPPLAEVTAPSEAFWSGFETAIDALYVAQQPELSSGLQRGYSLAPEEREQLDRYDLVLNNALRFRFSDGKPTSELRPRGDALRTPGVVARFLYRLLQTTSDYYPQKYLLWFANFESAETPYAKVLLAVNRMPRKQVSVSSFIDSYVETFPAERDPVLSLAASVFGPPVPGE